MGRHLPSPTGVALMALSTGGAPNTSQAGHDHAVCPFCRAELCAGKIRETIVGDWTEYDIVDFYGPDAICYSTAVHVLDVDRRYGCTRCPECLKEWR